MSELDLDPKESTEPQKDSTLSTKRDLANPCADKPSKVDLLGRQGLVSILKGLIDRESRKHIIVALFGRWGSGKSSVVQLLENSYENSPNNCFIVFNAWQAEHSKSMAASMANHVIESLYDSRGMVDQVLLSLKSRFNCAKVDLFREAFISFLVVAFCVGFIIPTFMDSVNIGMAWVTALSLFFALLIPIVRSYSKHPLTVKIKELSKRPDFNTHIGLGHSIREQLASLLSMYPHSVRNWLRGIFSKTVPTGHKYILVIDDLDRCSDEKIIETLEVVQLIVDLPGVSIVIAVDHQVLLEAVAARYQNQRQNLTDGDAFQLARNYLGKILQITISLDRPSSNSRNNFIRTRLYGAVKGEFAELPNVPVFKREWSEDEQEFDPMDFSDYHDDYDDDEYDHSDAYLEETLKEYDFFARCAGVFDIHNPRTLIRIHNAVSLLKGLYPDITDDQDVLNSYIYIVFWFEVFSTQESVARHQMQEWLFLDSTDNVIDSTEESLAESIGLRALSIAERRKILYRAKNLSLPFITNVGGDVTRSGLNEKW